MIHYVLEVHHVSSFACDVMVRSKKEVLPANVKELKASI